MGGGDAEIPKIYSIHFQERLFCTIFPTTMYDKKNTRMVPFFKGRRGWGYTEKDVTISERRSVAVKNSKIWCKKRRTSKDKCFCFLIVSLDGHGRDVKPNHETLSFGFSSIFFPLAWLLLSAFHNSKRYLSVIFQLFVHLTFSCFSYSF